MTLPVRATYRVQLGPRFGFGEAVGILDHLSLLGVSHLYVSPVLEAVPGSTHGYDVTDHRVVRRALGGDEGMRRLVEELRAREMGLIVDLVPNHVSVAVPRENPRWWDLLAHGPDARSARWFDVDWASGDGRVVLPVLGDLLEREVESGAIEVRRRGDQLVIGYHDLELPVAEGTAGDGDVGARGDRLREILGSQHHRLSHWRAGDRNYRVFFDIDSLAAIRVEDPVVFEEVHERLVDWVRDDLVDGVRVDHVDGLLDPGAYLARLRQLVGEERTIWVEKILQADESLPPWPVEGTTGYEFARLTTGIAVDPVARDTFDALWARWGGGRTYEELEWDAKRAALAGGLAPELRRVVAAASDAGLGETGPAIVELVVAFGAYRTYGTGTDPLGRTDVARLGAAADRARSWRPDLSPTIDALVAALEAPVDERAGRFRARFQQLTSPAMAKGAEDTAFYRHHRLIALAEVGADPSRFGVDVEELHAHNRAAAESAPLTMLAASTHDTKRSADVRARLAALTHRPERWVEAVEAWHREAGDLRPPVLDRATEYLFWQTLVGAWPISTERVQEYLTKATREAGIHTSWTDVDESYESGLLAFARAAQDRPSVSGAVESFVDDLWSHGERTRLAEVALRLTSPGVPDTYQGDQDWTRDLVDPDNRHPVDHAGVQLRLQRAIAVGDLDELAVGHDSLAKLWLTHRLLRLRRDQPTWFDDGEYEDLEVASPGGVGYRRGDVVVAVDARPGIPLTAEPIVLPPGSWRDVVRRDRFLEGGPLAQDEVWPDVRVAVLVPG